MKKTGLILGVVSLVMAASLFLLDFEKIIPSITKPNIVIYPAWFFVLLGAVLIFRSLKGWLFT